jgi:type 1 fimbriae regulatory protein FimB
MAAKVSPTSTHRNVQSSPPVDAKPRDYLTASEIELLTKAAKQGRHGVRDYAMVLLAYRHGLRVSELVGMHLDQLDWPTAHLWVARKKGSLSAQHPLDGDELRALRAWFRVRAEHPSRHLPYVFLSERGPCTRQMLNYLVAAIGKRAGLLLPVHPHMLRHSPRHNILYSSGELTRPYPGYISSMSPQGHPAHRRGPSMC